MTSVADLFLFLHQFRSIIALESSTRIALLNRLRANGRAESKVRYQYTLVYCFNVLTSTDIVVAGGTAQLGDSERVAGLKGRDVVRKAQASIKKQLEHIIDK